MLLHKLYKNVAIAVNFSHQKVAKKWLCFFISQMGVATNFLVWNFGFGFFCLIKNRREALYYEIQVNVHKSSN